MACLLTTNLYMVRAFSMMACPPLVIGNSRVVRGEARKRSSFLRESIPLAPPPSSMPISASGFSLPLSLQFFLLFRPFALHIGFNGFPGGCSDDKLTWAKESKTGNPLERKYPAIENG